MDLRSARQKTCKFSGAVVTISRTSAFHVGAGWLMCLFNNQKYLAVWVQQSVARGLEKGKTSAFFNDEQGPRKTRMNWRRERVCVCGPQKTQRQGLAKTGFAINATQINRTSSFVAVGPKSRYFRRKLARFEGFGWFLALLPPNQPKIRQKCCLIFVRGRLDNDFCWQFIFSDKKTQKFSKFVLNNDISISSDEILI